MGMLWKLRKKLKTWLKRFRRAPRLKFTYGWYFKHGKIKDNQVLFESFHGKDVSDSPLAILKEYLQMEESKGSKIYFATNDKKRDKVFIDSIGLDVTLVDILSVKYTKVLATSKYLINNSSFPAYFIRRPEQVYLQTWHGTPLKTLGKKMRFGIESMYNVQHNFLHANYVMFPNKFTRDAIMEDYNLENLYTGDVVMNGYPRNAVFMDREKEDQIRKKLGNETYTTLAYMPTWRGQSNYAVDTDQYSIEVNKLLQSLDKTLLDTQKLYVNFHPMVQKFIRLDNYKHIEPFPLGVDKYEFLNSVDALITDYSSVFFDYSITRKPIILYMYDYDEYMQDRGMYFDVKELPFRKIYELEELKRCIAIEEFKDSTYENDRAYQEKYLAYDSIDAAKNMARLVFQGDRSGIEIDSYEKNREQTRRAVQFPRVNTPEHLDTIAKIVDPARDILIFEKRFFNPELSSYLHDNYPDQFDYIFITRTTPRTFWEEFQKHRQNQRVLEELQKRETLRCFAGLSVEEELLEFYYHGQEGETFNIDNEQSIEASMEVTEDGFEIWLDTPDPGIKRILLAKKSLLVWSRELTEQEQQEGVIHEDFEALFREQDFENNSRYVLLVEAEDARGERTPYYLANHKELEKREARCHGEDMLPMYSDQWVNKGEILFPDNPDMPVETGLVPYIGQTYGRLSIFSGTLQEALQRSVGKVRGNVIRYKRRGTKVFLRLKYSKFEAEIKNVVLRYRSSMEEIEYPFDYTVRETDKYWIIDASIDFAGLELQEIYWDVFVLAEKYGEQIELSAYWRLLRRLRLIFLDYQIPIDEEHVAFPYSTKGHKIAFTYRVSSKYDRIRYTLKEELAVLVYTILKPYYRRKRVWLVFEKFCVMAQDNAYYFFKYCMEELPEKERKRIFYVLDRDSQEWEKMQQYKKQIIPFMSFRHMLYLQSAEIFVGSDSKAHLYKWRPKPNIISKSIRRKKILFLQHGVTALKRVDGIFGNKGSNPMTHFTTTSRFEQSIVVENFDYMPEDAPVLGFTRWDVLEDTKKPDEKIILAMPTWRAWLEEKSAEIFVESDYYKNYMNLLQSQRLKRILEDHDVKLIFYIHPKFRQYLSEFNASGDQIEMIPFGEEPLNEIMKKCHMLITDYSSVCWDVYYLEKPVLFYQFDYDMYMQVHGSYMDMEHELFGDRYMNYEDLIDGIEQYIENDFREKPEYEKMRDGYFAYRDNDNSKRTYEYLISKGY